MQVWWKEFVDDIKYITAFFAPCWLMMMLIYVPNCNSWLARYERVKVGLPEYVTPVEYGLAMTLGLFVLEVVATVICMLIFFEPEEKE